MSYEVEVTREGSQWLADVPAVPGAHTFANSLDALRDSVREVIVLMADLPNDATPEYYFTFPRRVAVQTSPNIVSARGSSPEK